ncbi:hypothetical protein X551_04663 [Methylibium sp. T29]|nr:hypothetical protein X551_04663 [Methylibium sp. T29]EWS57278.1 hypothetical protein Y694_04678 [Methylibium sp. T29-B]
MPATTAAGGRGFSSEPSGTTTRSGFRQPALSGMSSPTSVRKTYSTAAIVTDFGALKLPSSCWALLPLKSMQALRAVASTLTCTAICAPLSSGSV